MAKQGTLPLVEEIPKQGREAESQKWDWVEAEVWTGRMLATLDNGVKGGPMPTLSNRAVYHDHSPCRDQSVPPWTPLTGEPDAGDLHVRLCVQLRLACSVGVSPTRVKVRSSVAWMAGWRETETLKPIDKAIFRVVSESLGRNANERRSGLENAKARGPSPQP